MYTFSMITRQKKDYINRNRFPSSIIPEYVFIFMQDLQKVEPDNSKANKKLKKEVKSSVIQGTCTFLSHCMSSVDTESYFT